MLIMVICCYLSLLKVRCKQMHCGWQWLFNVLGPRELTSSKNQSTAPYVKLYLNTRYDVAFVSHVKPNKPKKFKTERIKNVKWQFICYNISFKVDNKSRTIVCRYLMIEVTGHEPDSDMCDIILVFSCLDSWSICFCKLFFQQPVYIFFKCAI
jgi:hypothetical protein